MTLLDQLLEEIFAESAADIREDTKFDSVPGWDSLRHVELVVGVESRFGVDLSAAEIARLTTKGGIREVLVARGRDV
jgi:acyl carrier protein